MTPLGQALIKGLKEAVEMEKKPIKTYIYYCPFYNLITESLWRRKRKNHYYLYGIPCEDFKCYYIGEL